MIRLIHNVNGIVFNFAVIEKGDLCDFRWIKTTSDLLFFFRTISVVAHSRFKLYGYLNNKLTLFSDRNLKGKAVGKIPESAVFLEDIFQEVVHD